MRNAAVAVLVVIVIALVWWSKADDSRQGIFHPKESTLNEVYSPIFETVAECFAWRAGMVQASLLAGNLTMNFDEFECGKS